MCLGLCQGLLIQILSSFWYATWYIILYGRCCCGFSEALVNGVRFGSEWSGVSDPSSGLVSFVFGKTSLRFSHLDHLDYFSGEPSRVFPWKICNAVISFTH